LSTKRWRQSE